MQSEDSTVIALFDVLGFESRLRSAGLKRMSIAYDRVAKVVNQERSGVVLDAHPAGDGTSVPCMGYVVVQQDYFSDTFIFWAKYDSLRFKTFCRILSEFFCHVLRLGVPLRGGVAVGEAIMDKSKRTYLGEPLVEAAHVEKAQQWVGVSFGPSFTHPPFSTYFDPEFVVFYTAHRKPGHSEHVPGLVLDWPRHWRKSISPNPAIDLRRLDSDPRYSRYYCRTVEFIEHSEKNADWYKRDA